MCLIVPHTEKRGGAYSQTLRAFEYEYMTKFYLDHLKPALWEQDLSTFEFYRDEVGIVQTYAEALKQKPFLIMEWHFNAHKGKAWGFEMLYKKDNPVETQMVEEFSNMFDRVLKTPRRTNKELTEGELGFVSVSQSGSRIPSILFEPFFGDNPFDAKNFDKKKEQIAQNVAEIANKYRKMID